MDKKAQIGSLVGIGLSLVILTVVIIVGMVIGTNLGNTVGGADLPKYVTYLERP